MFQGESLKRLLQGMAVGAVVTMIVGFNWGGWMLGGTAKQVADTQANSAVMAALAPICVAQFQSAADAPSQLALLKKVSTWEQGSFIEKGGWDKMPGSKSADNGVARACANMLDALK
jgi:nucleoid-associated protein YgaU